ncbi:MAG: hypothetical protein F6K56_03095 [Moorea sp. SIO3G5]|nr:hypothetical protein [Moorena sp. SIO3G5]
MKSLLNSAKTHSSSNSLTAIGTSDILPKGAVADSQEKNYTHTTHYNTSATDNQQSLSFCPFDPDVVIDPTLHLEQHRQPVFGKFKHGYIYQDLLNPDGATITEVFQRTKPSISWGKEVKTVKVPLNFDVEYSGSPIQTVQDFVNNGHPLLSEETVRRVMASNAKDVAELEEELMIDGLLNISQIQELRESYKNQLVSQQLRNAALGLDRSVIYSNQPRHQPFCEVSPLEHYLGVKMRYIPQRLQRKHCQSIEVGLYGHFLTVDTPHLFHGEAQEVFINDYLLNRFKISAKKRVTTPYNKPLWCDFVEIELEDGSLANLKITFIDSAFLRGAAKYDNLLVGAGLPNDQKQLSALVCDEMKEQGLIANYNPKKADQKCKEVLGYKPIERMDVIIEKFPNAFDVYSFGDLKVSDILTGYNRNNWALEEELGIPVEARTPISLTLGRTVMNTIEKCLCQHPSVSLDWSQTKSKKDEDGNKLPTERDIFYNLIRPANANKLIKRNDSAILLASPTGGRCYNAESEIRRIIDIIRDIDKGGAYGTVQQNMILPMGKPEILSYTQEEIDSRTCMTVGYFLDDYYKDDLVDNTWVGVLKTKEPLSFSMAPIFMSLINPSEKYDNDALKKVLEQQTLISEHKASNPFIWEKRNKKRPVKLPGVSLDDNIITHLSKEIHYAKLTSSILDLIMSVGTPAQIKELKEKVMVVAAIVYPKSGMCENRFEYEAKMEEYHTEMENKTIKTKERIKHENYAERITRDVSANFWFPVHLGEAYAYQLKARRNQYPKKVKNPDSQFYGGKHPMNTAFKDVINTAYGCFASKFFVSSNVVVADNITSALRCATWYDEQALGQIQSITDGGANPINQVTWPSTGRRITLTGRKGLLELKHGKTAPLNNQELAMILNPDTDNYSTVVKSTGEKITGKEIDQLCEEHTRRIFPTVKLLNETYMDVVPDFVCNSKGKKIENIDGSKTVDVNNPYKLVPRIGMLVNEGKDTYQEAIFGKKSDYQFLRGELGEEMKERGFNAKKDHVTLTGGLIPKSETPVVKYFTNQHNPNYVKPVKPQMLSQLLKISTMTQSTTIKERYVTNGMKPGDNILKVVRQSFDSISRYTFQTKDQFLAWNKWDMKERDKTGSGISKFFQVIPDPVTGKLVPYSKTRHGTDIDTRMKVGVDLEKMDREVNRLIKQGALSPAHLHNYEEFVGTKDLYYQLGELLKRIVKVNKKFGHGSKVVKEVIKKNHIEDAIEHLLVNWKSDKPLYGEILDEMGASEFLKFEEEMREKFNRFEESMEDFLSDSNETSDNIQSAEAIIQIISKYKKDLESDKVALEIFEEVGGLFT